MPAQTLLAVSLTRSDPPLTEQVRDAIQAGAEIIELRCDCISDLDAVDALLRAPREIPYIVTVRNAAEGGRWSGSESDRLQAIERFAEASPEHIDIEWRADFKQPTGKHKLILSYHDLAGTPADLDAIFDQMESLKPNGVKAVFTSRDALDAFRVLEQLHRRGHSRPLTALAMGEAGLSTRVLAKKFDGFLTFASLRPGAESAPGQPTITDLRNIYRWDDINHQTGVFGVIGWPVSHSLSPRLHNAAMASEGVDGIYLPLPIEPTYERLAEFLDYVSNNAWLDLAGVSVTIPHKKHVARWLEDRGHAVSEIAGRCGAVNTLVRTPNGWLGENSDAPGAIDALESAPELSGGRLNGRGVDVLGAGGVARAVSVALVERGCTVTIYNRGASRAAELARELRCRSAPWESRMAGDGEVLINCTSVGMAPRADESPVPSERLASRPVVFDTIYNPARTALLREAESHGCRAVGGLEMFISQAARQFALWHNRPAPLAYSRQVMRDLQS